MIWFLTYVGVALWITWIGAMFSYGEWRGRDVVVVALTWPVAFPYLFLRLIVRELRSNW